MTGISWTGLNTRERRLLLEALTSLRTSDPKRAGRIDALTAKLVHAVPFPSITIGVHGGQVQWTQGNPFPIRVCDYDGSSDDDLPDIDERGQRCRMWWEPVSVG